MTVMVGRESTETKIIRSVVGQYSAVFNELASFKLDFQPSYFVHDQQFGWRDWRIHGDVSRGQHDFPVPDDRPSSRECDQSIVIRRRPLGSKKERLSLML